jgi:hypothetical protein
LVLQFSDVLGLGTSIILFHLKAHPVTFSKCLESRHIDGRMMDKYVPTLVVLTDKTKSLLIVKPLYSSLWHTFEKVYQSDFFSILLVY